MIVWRQTPGGVMIPKTWGRVVEKPAAPCPAHVREKLRALREEFAAKAAKAAKAGRK